MKRADRLILWFLILLGSAQVCAFGQSGCAQLVWSDEFDYTGAPDASKWGYDLGGGGWGNNEVQVYTDDLANASVDNGLLTIKAIKSGETWSSARLVTRNKGDWLYGRIEVRAKLPYGVGTWPAIWMLPTDWEYGGWPSSGEIDVMEHVGSDLGRVHGTVHTESYNHTIGTQVGASILVSNVTGSFHVYAIEWTENEIKWYVDDQHYFTFENEQTGYQTWPFDKRFHLILNIAMGGNWGGDIDPNLTDATMEIDYVRVYNEAPPQLKITGPEYIRQEDTARFSATYYSDYSYSWDVPDGVTILGGENTHEITLLWGEKNDTIRVHLTTPCATYTSLPYLVKAILVPKGNELVVPNKDTLDNILWTISPTTGNTIDLSLDGDNLVVDFTITDKYGNPHIYLDLDQITDLTVLPKMHVRLSAEENMEPSNFRFDLMDTQGEVNLDDLFTITNLPDDDQFHDYLYLFGQKDNEVYMLDQIKQLRLYFNYSFAGKEHTGRFVLPPVRMVLSDYTLGIHNKILKPLTLFPNPASEMITIELPLENPVQSSHFLLLNSDGKVLRSTLLESNHNRMEFDISELVPGLYHIVIVSEEEMFRQTFIKL